VRLCFQPALETVQSGRSSEFVWQRIPRCRPRACEKARSSNFVNNRRMVCGIIGYTIMLSLLSDKPAVIPRNAQRKRPLIILTLASNGYTFRLTGWQRLHVHLVAFCETNKWRAMCENIAAGSPFSAKQQPQQQQAWVGGGVRTSSLWNRSL